MGWGTILGGALGFIASVIPEILAIIKAQYEHSNRVESTKQGIEINIQNVLPAAPPAPPSRLNMWMDALRTSVRPVITYLFFGLFFTIKLAGIHHALLVEHLSVVNSLPAIWDAETSSLFAAVVLFWFGSRSMRTVASRVPGLVNGDAA